MKTIHIGPNESITITADGDSIELAAMLEASGALGGTTIAKARWLINDRASLIKTLESVRRERDEARDEARDHRGRTISCNETLDACHRLLDSAGIDSDIITERIADIVTARSDLVERVYVLGSRLDALHKIIADFDPCENPGPDRYPERLRALLTVLTDERADLARRLEQAEDERDALKTHRDDAMRVIDAIDAMVAPLNMSAAGDRLDDVVARVVAALTYAREEIDALRPKQTAPVVEWVGIDLYVGDDWFARVGPSESVWCVVDVSGKIAGRATSDESARKLAELLAGHDPGGRWTVAGHTVPVDVVRAVCGTVAVGWEAA